MFIWKYVLKIVEEQSIAMPEEAKILSLQFQNRELCFWAEVDPDNKPIKARRFTVIGTGHPVKNFEGLSHVGTVQQGPYVWHVYEVNK